MKFLFTLLFVIPVVANAQIQPKYIDAAYGTTATIIFPAEIAAIDYGSGDLLVKPMAKDTRVVKLKAARKNFTPTNLTILTSTGELYCIPVRYRESISQEVYDANAYGTHRNVATSSDSSASEMKNYCQQLYDAYHLPIAKRNISIAKCRRQGVELKLQQILTHERVLYFVIQMINYSHLGYKMHTKRFYQHTRRQNKKAIVTESELNPLYEYPPSKNIETQTNQTIIIAFDQFTLNRKKSFTIQYTEKEGNRTLRLEVESKHILRAKPF